jgi:hypothetical protein
MAQQRQCAKYDAYKRAILPRGECVGWWIGRRLDGGEREVVVCCGPVRDEAACGAVDGNAEDGLELAATAGQDTTRHNYEPETECMYEKE